MDCRDIENYKKLVDFNMRMLQARIDMESMIVANKERESRDEAMAYDEKSFVDLIDKYAIYANAFPDIL